MAHRRRSVRDEAPDFVGLYGDHGPVTPRMAYYLWAVANDIGTLHRDLVGDPGFFGFLPPICAQIDICSQREWQERFCASFTTIGHRLAKGDLVDEPLPTCAGDEVALAVILDLARDLVHDHAILAPEEQGLDLPLDDTLDWAFARDQLAEDSDVDWLWDPTFDVESDTRARLHGMVNLHPQRWFLPFE